jgi:hypothetical protein
MSFCPVVTGIVDSVMPRISPLSFFGVYFLVSSTPFLLPCCLLLTATLSASEPQTGIEGIITISPVHGGPTRMGVPDSRALADTTFIAQKQNGMAAFFTTDDHGRFRVSLEPGHYTVSLKEKKGGIGRYGPFEVDVVDRQMTKVEWRCDTGMR